MVLDVPKGLGARPHQRGRRWALNHEFLGLWKATFEHRFQTTYACMLLAYACVPRNPNFDNSVGPTSNGHNTLNINPN